MAEKMDNCGLCGTRVRVAGSGMTHSYVPIGEIRTCPECLGKTRVEVCEDSGGGSINKRCGMCMGTGKIRMSPLTITERRKEGVTE